MLVVDNGSTDRSREEAQAAGARVVEETQRGYGAAHRRGFAEARGNVIVMADADDTYDLSDLTALVSPLGDGFDMVVGNRLKTLSPGSMTWSHRFIGTPTLTALLGFFSGARLGDSQCGLRAFTREAYERMELKSTGMELASEMILKSARRGLRMAEVPIPYHPRLDRKQAEHLPRRLAASALSDPGQPELPVHRSRIRTLRAGHSDAWRWRCRHRAALRSARCAGSRYSPGRYSLLSA